MYRIKTLNKISSAGLARLDQTRFQVGNDVENEDGILVRSAAMHDYEFPQALRAIARAGAGTNNIPIDRCSENGIVVFNTPGANANAVKELVVAAMLIASRDIMGGAKWVQEQANTEGVDVAAAVEKGSPPLWARSCIKRPWVSSAWVPSARWCAMRPWSWAWTCTAMTPSCLWTPLCAWTATSMW